MQNRGHKSGLAGAEGNARGQTQQQNSNQPLRTARIVARVLGERLNRRKQLLESASGADQLGNLCEIDGITR
jgi:hypothetical protein